MVGVGRNHQQVAQQGRDALRHQGGSYSTKHQCVRSTAQQRQLKVSSQPRTVVGGEGALCRWIRKTPYANHRDPW